MNKKNRKLEGGYYIGLKELFKLKKWEPDLTRTPPDDDDWPDHILTLNNKRFDSFIDKFPVSVVDFWAPWCAPCRIISPIVEELAASFDDQVKFVKCNVDENPVTPTKYGIQAIPNLIFFNGKP